MKNSPAKRNELLHVYLAGKYEAGEIFHLVTLRTRHINHIELPHWRFPVSDISAVCGLCFGGAALAPVAGSTSYFAEIVLPRGCVIAERLRGILELQVVDRQVAGSAAVCDAPFLIPYLRYLYRRRLQLSQFFLVWRLIQPPPDKLFLITTPLYGVFLRHRHGQEREQRNAHDGEKQVLVAFQQENEGKYVYDKNSNYNFIYHGLLSNPVESGEFDNVFYLETSLKITVFHLPP